MYDYNEAINNYHIERIVRSHALEMKNTHYHNHYEIYYLISGKIRYFIENAVYDVNAGDIILIPPKIIHKTSSVDDKATERLLISFTKDFPYGDNEIFKCFQAKKISFCNVYSILMELEKEAANNDLYSENIIKNNISLLLSILSRHYSNAQKELFDTTDTIIKSIIEYIEENYNSELSLEFLSKKFALSKSHLSRKFKENTGLCLNEYITLVRIRNSENLLRKTKHSVTDIAIMCGFNDSGYFTHVFKKLKGVTPLKFRNS